MRAACRCCRRCRCCCGSGCCRRCCFRCRCGSAFLNSGDIVARLSDCTDIDQNRYLVSILIEDVQKCSFCCGLALKRSLVRLIGEKNIAHIDVVALLLQPFRNHTFLYGDSRLWHQYAYCHFFTLHYIFLYSSNFITYWFRILYRISTPAFSARFLKPSGISPSVII